MSEELDLYNELDDAREKILALRQRLAAAEAALAEAQANMAAVQRLREAVEAERDALATVSGAFRIDERELAALRAEHEAALEFYDSLNRSPKWRDAVAAVETLCVERKPKCAK